MASRYGRLTLYIWTLAIVAAAALAVVGVQGLPPWWVIVLCVLACLFVFQFGVRAPRVGLISMERVPHIGMLLVLGPAPAAAISAVASFLWPLLNRPYNQGSWRVAVLRGVHNSAMTALMLLVAGLVYERLGGSMPLQMLQWRDVWPLVAAIVTVQVINIAFMTLYFNFDGREVRRIITPSYALSDLIFAPAGVLAALLFNADRPAVFVLFVGLMILFVLSFNGMQGFGNANVEQGLLGRLFKLRRALHGTRSVDVLTDRVAQEAGTLFRYDEFDVALREDSGKFTVRVRNGAGERVDNAPADIGALFAWVVERNESVLIADWRTAPAPLRSTSATDVGSIIAAPIIDDETCLGVLCVRQAKIAAYSEADVHLLARLAEEFAAALIDTRAFEDAEEYRQRLEQRVAERTAELQRANTEKERLIAALRERSQVLERESQEDPLTGLANRRAFMQRLRAEMDVAKAVGHPLTMAIADLDHFKAVNDRLGHRLGDEALRHSALSMRGLCRETDLLARIGGEEFALLMPGVACDAALQLCNAMRRKVETFDWQAVHPELRLTISIGIWQWDGKATVAELLQAADMQLYEAKRGGRNRVA